MVWNTVHDEMLCKKNIGCRSLYWDEKGYIGKRNLVGRGRRKLEQNSSSVL